MKIFIADGSVILCKKLVRIISALEGVEIAGYSVDGREALKLIRRVKPEVAIIDIHLPLGSGLQLLKKIKQEKCAPFVMLLINEDLVPYREKCREAGADALICKPKELERAVEVLQNLLDCEVAIP